MPVVACPSCKTQLMVRDEDLGKLIQCPTCNQKLQTTPPSASKTVSGSRQMARPPMPQPPGKPAAASSTAKTTSGASAKSPGAPPSPASAPRKLSKKVEEEDEEENNEDEDEEEESRSSGPISKKKRIWMGWESGHKGLSLATTGMIVYLVGVVLGGLAWASYAFTRETVIFYLALAISVLSGLAFLVLDLWGRSLLTQVPPEKVPAAKLLFSLSLGAFILCYLFGGVSAAVPMGAIGAVIFLGLGYWLAVFALWIVAKGLYSNKLAALLLTHGCSVVALNLIGAIFCAVMFLGLGVKPDDIRNFGGQNNNVDVLLVGLGVVSVINLGLYFWAINLCMQLIAVLGEKIGK